MVVVVVCLWFFSDVVFLGVRGGGGILCYSLSLGHNYHIIISFIKNMKYYVFFYDNPIRNVFIILSKYHNGF